MDKPSPELRAVLMASVSPLLTERGELLAAIAKAIERIDYIDQKVLAAATMLDEPAPLLAPIPGVSESAREGVRSEAPMPADAPHSWREFILAVLKGTERGFTNAEIMERASAIGLGSFAERFRKSPNGYFAALRLLDAEKAVIRKGALRYLPDTFRRIEAGELTDAPRKGPPKIPGSASSVVLGQIAAHGPMTAREIIRRLAASPHTAEFANRRVNTVYAVLSKLVVRATLMRDPEGRYRLPSQQAPEVAANVTLFPSTKGTAMP